MPSSTWKNRNIFEDVLSHEDALTDALRNFLKYPPVQDALWRTLPKTIQESVDFSLLEDTQTRSSGGHSEGIPDLVLYGPDFILVIEVKIGARLTNKHQRNAYVPWIKKESQNSKKEMGFVVFLIPDEYSHRPQLDSCLERAKKLCRSNNSKIQVLDPTTWQKFVTELASQDMPSLNELIREFYDYLYEKFEPVIFFTEEVRLMHSNKMASGIRKLIKIVDKVNLQLRLRNPSQDSSGYGYNFSDPKKKKFVWFGIWWEYWAEKGFPLCVAISKKNYSSSILNAFKKQSGIKFVDFTDEEDGKWLVVGYELPEPNEDCSKLIAKIVTDIENLLR